MSGSLPKKALRFCGFLLLLVAAGIQLLFALQEQSVFNEMRGGKSAFLQSSDPQLLTLAAKEKHLFEGDMPGALSRLQRALTSNTYHVPAWLALAELYNDMGNKERAYAILDYMTTLTGDLKRWRWEKTLVEYQLGRLEVLPAELGYIIHEIPGKNRRDALQLAFSLWDDPQQLLDNIGGENLLALFTHAVQKKMADKALFFWQTIEASEVVWQEKQLLAFLDMLLRTGKISEAATIWHRYLNPDHLVYNGDFSKPFIRRAFGWRTGKHQGFVQRLEHPGGRNKEQESRLHYRFKGWENISFHHLYQIVPLTGGGHYRLTTTMKSQKLTTDKRPYFEVYGYKCKMKRGRSEMVEADQDWTSYQLDFEVPTDCSAVVIRLRRSESLQIDNKLSGQLWLKNVAISKLDQEPLFPEIQP